METAMHHSSFRSMFARRWVGLGIVLAAAGCSIGQLLGL